MPDANVLIGWLFDLFAPFEFVASLTTADDVLAAQVLLPECTSTLRAAVFDTRLEPREAQEMLARLVDFPMKQIDSTQQFVLALDFAARFRHRRAYDMQYLAVAALQDAQLVTLDRGMRHAAEDAGVPVRFLGQ